MKKKHKIKYSAQHETRNKERLVMPTDVFNLYGNQQRRYLTPFYFNSLPSKFKTITSYVVLKKEIKIWTLNNIK